MGREEYNSKKYLSSATLKKNDIMIIVNFLLHQWICLFIYITRPFFHQISEKSTTLQKIDVNKVPKRCWH